MEPYLRDCHALVLEELHRFLPNNRFREVLYDLMLDYPLRAAKGLRPALAIATCRALGGRLEDVLATAAVLELYHNAFLIHDDIEDGSIARRGFPTLHREYGVPIAVNTGDAMLALALRPLLENTRTLGLGRALEVLECVADMALHSAEGQALELAWIRDGAWDFEDRDYWLLVYKKTCWYTFVAPTRIGALVAGSDARAQRDLRCFAVLLGVAFQIQDDVLNLVASEARYGKEIAGDLWEGKHTLILMHAVRNADAAERDEAMRVLAIPREQKTPEQVTFLSALVEEADSIDYARGVAGRAAARASRVFERTQPWLRSSIHRDFLAGLVDYVTERDR